MGDEILHLLISVMSGLVANALYDLLDDWLGNRKKKKNRSEE